MNERTYFGDGVSSIQEKRLKDQFSGYADKPITKENYKIVKNVTEGIYATIGGTLAQIREDDNKLKDLIKSELKKEGKYGITKKSPYYVLYELIRDRFSYAMKNITWRNMSDEILWKYIEMMQAKMEEMFTQIETLERDNSDKRAHLQIIEAQNITRDKDIEEKVKLKKVEQDFELDKLRIDKELQKREEKKKQQISEEPKKEEAKVDPSSPKNKYYEDIYPIPDMPLGLKEEKDNENIQKKVSSSKTSGKKYWE